MKFILAKSVFVLALLASLTCASDWQLPDDPDLEIFIETSSRCAYLERAYAHDEDLLNQELAELQIPADLDSLVESLLDTYGAEPEFWHLVYLEIQERSRK